MATVQFDQATRIFPGADRPAVDRLDLDIGDGEFLVLVGPSGCGKSTSLRMLAGLEDVDSGTVRIGPRDVTDVAPKDRDIAMVFQSYALYPHMSVADNMGFALRIAGRSKDEIQSRVREAARVLDLEQLLDRKPKALSGGQRQRVAMGRAIVREPAVFLMDEPLSNLDAKLRTQTRSEIAALQRRLGVTTLYVTHDQVEAMTMGDRVAVLRDGILQQSGTPREIFRRPANVFVAGFMGSPAMALVELPIVDGGAEWAGHRIPLPRPVTDVAGGRVVVGFRPEAAALGDDGVEARVSLVEELGSDSYVHLDAVPAEPGGDRTRVVVRSDPARAPEMGAQIRFRPDPEGVHAFDPATGARIEPS